MCYKENTFKSTRPVALKTLTQLIADAAVKALPPDEIVSRCVKAVCGDFQSELEAVEVESRANGYVVIVTGAFQAEVEGRDLYRVYKLVQAFFPADIVKVSFVDTVEMGDGTFDRPEIRVRVRSPE